MSVLKPQFSFRLLLALITVLSVGIGLLSSAARQQAEAVSALLARGVILEFSEPGSIATWLLRHGVPSDYLIHVKGVTIPLEPSRPDWRCGAPPPSMVYFQDLLKPCHVDCNLFRYIGQLSKVRSVEFYGMIQADYLSSLSTSTTVERLSLAHTSVSSNALAQLEKIERLRDLDLSRTSIDDGGVTYLKRLRGLRTLKLGFTRVTVEGAAALHRALPDCEIEHWETVPDPE